MKNPIKRFLLKRLVRKHIENWINIYKEGVIESGGIVAGFYEEELLNDPNATLMTKNYHRMSFDEAMSFLNKMCNSLYCHSDQTLYIDQITDVILNSYPNYSIKELRNSEDTLDMFIHNAYHKIIQEEHERKINTEKRMAQAIDNMRRYNGED